MKKIRRYFLLRICAINKDSWDIRRNRQKFFVILGHFLPFYPTKKPKSQNFEKIKKKKKKKKKKEKTGDIIILHLSTTNDNHMMYGSWDMEYSRQNLFSFWTIFCPLTKKSKFWKKNLEISSAYICVAQMTTIWCIVP